MSKRFTDTDKYKKTFFRGLKGPYKLLWDYLYHDCDHAGIWIVDFEIAQIYIGPDMKVIKKDALLFFNKDEVRIIEFDEGKKWFIPSFIEFQYGTLKPTNRVHESIINILSKYNLDKPLISPLQGAKDKDKDKDKEKDKEKDKDKDKDISPKNNNSLHQNIIKIYCDWYDKKVGVKYPFQGGQDGAAVKTIIVNLRDAIAEKNKKDATDNDVINGWKFLLGSYDKWESFYQAQLKLSQISSNLANIYINIKGIKKDGKYNKTQAGELTEKDWELIEKARGGK